MPRILWPLWGHRPRVQVVLTVKATGLPLPRNLLADTGAGRRLGYFDLILDEADCLRCDGSPGNWITLRGAYSGRFRIYRIAV